jgi:addiction module RelE/StbE family toxin
VKVRWLNAATRSLRLVHARIAYDNPQAAKAVVRRIESSVARLSSFPMSGRLGQVAETRELVVPGLPYIVIYRVSGESVDILRVFHTSQEHPNPLH